MKRFMIFGLVNFILGLALYILKNQFVLLGDINAVAQFMIISLCIVFPSFYFLLGILVIAIDKLFVDGHLSLK